MKPFKFACATDIGSQRSSNQDCVALFPSLGLVVLADGMGGYRAGEVASRNAVEIVRNEVRKGFSLKSALTKTNTYIYKMARENDKLTGMGTTIVAAQFKPTKVKVASVGDSRFYRLRDGKLKQINRDQTVAEQLSQQGLDSLNGQPAEAYEHVLTEALGPKPRAEIQIENVDVEPEDIFLICSDGLSGFLSDDVITNTLLSKRQTLQNHVDSLIRIAYQNKVADNVTAAIIYYDKKT